jgi:hypothetical protein
VALDVNVMDFVEAAKLRGEGKIWVDHLPRDPAECAVAAGGRTRPALHLSVLFLSTLSFLGLGIQPPEADWGGMVKDNKDGIIFGILAALIPAAAIAILAISVNLVADWLLNRTTEPQGRARQWLTLCSTFATSDRSDQLSRRRIAQERADRRRRVADAREGQGAGADRRIRRRQVDHRPLGDGIWPWRRADHRRRGHLLNGRDILKLGKNGIRKLRGKEVCYVAQSAAAAFNPAHKADGTGDRGRSSTASP